MFKLLSIPSGFECYALWNAGSKLPSDALCAKCATGSFANTSGRNVKVIRSFVRLFWGCIGCRQKWFDKETHIYTYIHTYSCSVVYWSIEFFELNAFIERLEKFKFKSFDPASSLPGVSDLRYQCVWIEWFRHWNANWIDFDYAMTQSVLHKFA